jgi:hypothetical protein
VCLRACTLVLNFTIGCCHLCCSVAIMSLTVQLLKEDSNRNSLCSELHLNILLLKVLPNCNRIDNFNYVRASFMCGSVQDSNLFSTYNSLNYCFSQLTVWITFCFIFLHFINCKNIIFTIPSIVYTKIHEICNL